MRRRKIEQLAAQAVRELRREGGIFATDHVRKKGRFCEIAFSRGKTLRVFIDSATHNTEDAIYQEM